MKKFLLVFLSVSLLSGCVSSVSFNTGFIPPPRHYYSTTESVSVITTVPVTNGQTIVEVEEVIIPKQTVVIEKTYPVYPALSVGFFYPFGYYKPYWHGRRYHRPPPPHRPRPPHGRPPRPPRR